MTDKEKLDHIVKLWKSLESVDMFAPSDKYGIVFTEEYLNITEEIDNFIGGLSNVVF